MLPSTDDFPVIFVDSYHGVGDKNSRFQIIKISITDTDDADKTAGRNPLEMVSYIRPTPG